MNVQGTPVVQSSSLTDNSKMSQSTGAPTASLQGSGTSSGVGSSPSDATPTLTTGAATSSHQLSSGAIGGIVVVCFLFLIGLIILFVRRRSIAHRLQRRKQWFSGYATSDSFSIVGGSMQDSQGRGSPIRNRTSARSSFATNFDQGLMFRIDSPTSPLDVDFATFGTIPELPPMAEVRERTSVLFPSASAVSRRESMNSMMSNGSDSESQYLVVANDPNPPGLSSPMSVRPFSPSESFAFPKPPPCPNEGQCPSSLSAISGHGLVSPSSSAATLVQIHSPPPIFNSDLLPSNPPASYLPPSSPLTAIPETSSNPFADPVRPKFETVRRPFAPTLNDEVAVAPGDQVLIIKVFDDGWALVEKQCGPPNDNEKGLIPVDCLREAGQPLPAFLAQKQVTSYGADPNKLGQMLAGSFHAL